MIRVSATWRDRYQILSSLSDPVWSETWSENGFASKGICFTSKENMIHDISELQEERTPSFNRIVLQSDVDDAKEGGLGEL